MFRGIRQGKAVLALAILALLGVLIPEGVSASGSSYTYDPVGRVTTALYDNGTCVAYGYDANGNRTAQSITAGGAPVTPNWGTGVWGCISWTQQ